MSFPLTANVNKLSHDPPVGPVCSISVFALITSTISMAEALIISYGL